MKDTIDRLVIYLQERGLTIYARINRQVESKWHGLKTRPMEYILYDNPRLSGPLIEEDPTLALCFPMRIIAWEERDGACRVAYKDPSLLMKLYVPTRDESYWPDIGPVISRALWD